VLRYTYIACLVSLLFLEKNFRPSSSCLNTFVGTVEGEGVCVCVLEGRFCCSFQHIFSFNDKFNVGGTLESVTLVFK
jgi:hypothetical protein